MASAVEASVQTEETISEGGGNISPEEKGKKNSGVIGTTTGTYSC